MREFYGICVEIFLVVCFWFCVVLFNKVDLCVGIMCSCDVFVWFHVVVEKLYVYKKDDNVWA